MKTTSIEDILGGELFEEYKKVISMSSETDMCSIVFDEIPACPLEGCHLTIEDLPPKIDASLIDGVQKIIDENRKLSDVDFSVDECLGAIDRVCQEAMEMVNVQRKEIEKFNKLSEKFCSIYMTFLVFEKDLPAVSLQKSLKSDFQKEIYETIRTTRKKKPTGSFRKIDRTIDHLDFSDFTKFKSSLVSLLLNLGHVIDAKGKLNLTTLKSQDKDYKKFMMRRHTTKEINVFFVEFSLICELFDTEKREKEVMEKMSRIKCVINNLARDVKKVEDDDAGLVVDIEQKTISKDRNSYDITKPGYWRRFTKFLNMVSVLPTYWTTGIIVPPSTPIKLPIIHKFLVVIPVMPIGKIFVIWLTINGIVIFPTMLEISCMGSVMSTWKTLFRGSMQVIKQGGGSFVNNVNLEVASSNGASSVIDAKPESFSQNVLLSDDYPPFERMSLSNAKFLSFLNNMMQKAKPFMGLPA